MAESAKEARKVSDQVSEILRLVSDYDQPLHAIKALSHSVDAIATKYRGKLNMASKTQRAVITCAYPENRKERDGDPVVALVP